MKGKGAGAKMEMSKEIGYFQDKHFKNGFQLPEMFIISICTIKEKCFIELSFSNLLYKWRMNFVGFVAEFFCFAYQLNSTSTG